MTRIISAGPDRAWRLELADLHRSESCDIKVKAHLHPRGWDEDLGAPFPASAAAARGFDAGGLWVLNNDRRDTEATPVLLDLHYLSLQKGPVDISPWLADRSEDEIEGFLANPQNLLARGPEILETLHEAGNPTVRHAAGRAGLAAMGPLLELELLDPEGLQSGLEDTLRQREPSPEPDFA